MLKPFYAKERHYWRIVFLCFLVAATVWVLNALNKTYQNIRISYPVTFAYNPKKLVPVTPLPKEVVINVTGKGWKLLRKSLDLRIKPARIELKNLAAASYLTGPKLRPALNSVLDGLVLNYVVTDTIYFDFDRLAKRRLRLELADGKPLAASGYVISGKPEIVPSAIVVTGPAAMVFALPDPFPIAIPDSNLTKDFTAELPVAFLQKELIKPNVNDVIVTVNIKALRKNSLFVQVTAPENLPLNRFRLQPDSVAVSYFCHPDSTSILTPDKFEVTAVIAPGKLIDTVATLQLTKAPKKLKKVTVSPNKVKILQR